MADGILKKIQYMKKSEIQLSSDNVAPDARKVIDNAQSNDVLALRIKINSPVYIEAAALLTKEGIKEVCKVPQDTPFAKQCKGL